MCLNDILIKQLTVSHEFEVEMNPKKNLSFKNKLQEVSWHFVPRMACLRRSSYFFE